MHCLRHILIYLILIPMPSVSPLFLAIFTIAAYWAIRPCGYCMTILAILFFSTSPSSPFLAALAPASTTESEVPTPPTRFDLPIPDRGAFFLNGGRIFDPALLAYREMQRAWQDPVAKDMEASATGGEKMVDGAVDAEGDVNATVATETAPEVHAAVPTPTEGVDADGLGWWPGKWSSGMSLGSKPKAEDVDAGPGLDSSAYPSSPSEPQTKALSRPSSSLPPGYVDLRIGGVGLVLDLGWRRTDAGLRWEVDDVRYAADLRRQRRAAKDSRRKAELPVAAADLAPSSPEEEATSEELKQKRRWMGASFMGSW